MSGLPVLNISVYLFTQIDDTHGLQQVCLAQAQARRLKGTVLIAEEGINLFLAGEPAEVRSWVTWLRWGPRFARLVPKDSWSAKQPFKKLLVKVKNEIIRMNHPTIQPQHGRAPAVPPATLKRWLDLGHDVKAPCLGGRPSCRRSALPAHPSGIRGYTKCPRSTPW